MAEQQMRVLLIEDNPADARLIRELLAEAFGAALELQTADRLSAGLERLAQGGTDVVLLDLGLPDSQGIDTFVSLCAQAPETPVVVLTGLDDEMVAEQAARAGTQDYLLKGQGDSRSLRRALHYAMERKRAEEAVRRSEEQYRTLVENMSEVVYRFGIGPDPLQTQVQFVSDGVEQVLGYRPDEFSQDPGLWFRSIHPEDVAAVSATTQQMLRRRERCIRTYRLLPKEGREYRWFEDRVAPVFDSNGHIIALQGVARDVTESIEAEETLRLRTQELEALSRIASILAQPGTLEDRATQVLMQLVQVVQADHATLVVPDEENQGLRPLTSVGVHGSEPSMVTLSQLSQGLSGLTFQQGEPVLANDYPSHPLALPELVAAGRRSLIALPIRAGNRTQGVVAVSSDKAGHFTPERVRLLTAIADGMGALLENARLQEAERLRLEELATANQQLQREIGERTRAEEEVARSVTRLQQVLEGIVRAMASAVEMRDPYTAGHQQRVAQLALAISKRMGLTEDQQEAIRIAALLHDMGKIAVPSELLTKPGALSEMEFALIKTHPQVGYDMLETIEFPWDIATIASQHHERLDGSGYPFGLADGEIELEARVLAVADVVEAMASHRPYRPALGIEAALAEIRQQRGVLYDPAAVDACLELFATNGFRLK